MIKKTTDKLVRAYSINFTGDMDDEVCTEIKKVLADHYGDYIIIELNSDKNVFKDDFDGKPISYYYMTYRNDDGKWTNIYSGDEYPLAVGEAI